MSYRDHKDKVLKAVERHAQMEILLSCLTRSPNGFEEDVEDDEMELFASLIAQGLLDDVQNGWLQTTAEGREALIAYIKGE